MVIANRPSPFSKTSPTPSSRTIFRSSSRAMTLVEMLVALTITLIMMGVVVTYFASVTSGVAESRAQMEMADMLRGARNQLQNDLAGATCPTLPWGRSDTAAGYFEYFEGPNNDIGPYTGSVQPVPATLLGDNDDVLMFTCRSRDEKFVGYNGNGGVPFQSYVAEIVWYSVVETAPPQKVGFRTIYRRALLVAPWAISQIPAADLTVTASWTLDTFQVKYDLSAHVVGSSIVLNTMNDLADRKNRYRHNFTTDPANGYGYPHAMLAPIPFPSGTARYGEDVVLRNVLAFDVRAFDPLAPLRSVNSVAVGPGEVGWTPGGTATSTYTGAYVDLGYAFGASSGNGLPSHFSLAAAGTIGNTWDTWPVLYESDGLNQDGDSLTDEGTNGFDDDNNGIVDDIGERETQPPYSRALRGIQVMIRLYEPDSRQTRQVTVVQNFVPE